jgi:hypothetical protein
MMKKADLRPFVLEVLRRNQDTQFVAVEHKVAALAQDYKPHDALTVREIIWELLVQGILAPGFNSSNLDFPFIHVTEYGKRCLDADAILPHDPDRYLERLQRQIGQPLDDTVQTYVRESLLTFLAGRYLAATVMLGVASERCVDLLVDACTNAFASASRKSAFEKKTKQAGRSVKRRFDILRNELLALTLPTELRDALDIQLSGIFTLIRYTRNEAGHPTGRIIDRDAAHGNLLLFPQYYKRVHALLEYLQAASI